MDEVLEAGLNGSIETTRVELPLITDVRELKALAYDQLVVIEQAQANLKAINQRILQVQNGD